MPVCQKKRKRRPQVRRYNQGQDRGCDGQKRSVRLGPFWEWRRTAEALEGQELWNVSAASRRAKLKRMQHD